MGYAGGIEYEAVESKEDTGMAVKYFDGRKCGTWRECAKCKGSG